MSSQHVVSTASPKPKVFRLPPAAPVKLQETHRSGKKWRLGLLLLIVALLWPPLQKQTSAYFSSHKLKNASAPQAEELEGMLPPPVGDAQAALPAEKPPTIMLRGKSEAIIGQMAKIPAESEPITETRAVTTVDNNAKRELLSIISKY